MSKQGGKEDEKWADKKRRHMEYEVGDLVLVKISTLNRHKQEFDKKV